MSHHSASGTEALPAGVMFNAYPDSIGQSLADTVTLLGRPELKDAFSLFYVLPTFFNSDLDRGFSVIDYDLNRELVDPADLEALRDLGITLKFDLVLNHLSVASPQFQDLLRRGEDSPYRDFFIDWNAFWRGNGQMSDAGYLVPKEAHLQRLFMRKSGLPILKVGFPDGSDRYYWNTFYQEVSHRELRREDLASVAGLPARAADAILAAVNGAVRAGQDPGQVDLGPHAEFAEALAPLIARCRSYRGQMDLNADSELVWEFYDQTLRKLRGYGAQLVRLDAFAYLHKRPGMTNFFNKPGTWDYLERMQGMAAEHGLVLLPEIHAEYGYGLHEEVAGKGFPIYDFFFPGLVIDALERGSNRHLLRWIRELQSKQIRTVNMLGCHDGIPVLDLRGRDVFGVSRAGLLTDAEIESVITTIIDRGGRVKNLYGPDGKKIAYYQVNATFFSALGESERKLLLARAVQMFMPGIPQVWYLDLFAGANDYAAADRAGTAGHKEINRTNLNLEDVERGLRLPVVKDQLQLIRLRNTSPAFRGELRILESDEHHLHLVWVNGGSRATLRADLREHRFTVDADDGVGELESRAYG